MYTLDKMNVWMEYRLKNFGKQKTNFEIFPLWERYWSLDIAQYAFLYSEILKILEEKTNHLSILFKW